jgi:SAM-dependent methyltransferase
VTHPGDPQASAKPRRQFQQRVVDFAKRNSRFGNLFHAVSWQRSQTVVSMFERWLPASGRVLDIGAGTGHVAALLQRPDRRAIACDIVNLLMCPLPYVIADGKNLPFLDGSFDAVLLITVLHHVARQDHRRFLDEATRMLKSGGTLIVMEDTYHSQAGKQVTKLFDSIMNAEFAGHPHANRTLADWASLINGAGLRTQEQSEHVSWYGLFRMRHGVLVGRKECGDPPHGNVETTAS